jgi:hypothetical protein
MIGLDPSGAVSWIEGGGPLGQLPQFAAELLELPDALIEVGGVALEQVGDVALEQVGDVGAGGLAVVAEGDDLEDPAQGEADRLGGPNEPEASHGRPRRSHRRRPRAQSIYSLFARRPGRRSGSAWFARPATTSNRPCSNPVGDESPTRAPSGAMHCGACPSSVSRVGGWRRRHRRRSPAGRRSGGWWHRRWRPPRGCRTRGRPGRHGRPGCRRR